MVSRTEGVKENDILFIVMGKTYADAGRAGDLRDLIDDAMAKGLAKPVLFSRLIECFDDSEMLADAKDAYVRAVKAGLADKHVHRVAKRAGLQRYQP